MGRILSLLVLSAWLLTACGENLWGEAGDLGTVPPQSGMPLAAATPTLPGRMATASPVPIQSPAPSLTTDQPTAAPSSTPASTPTLSTASQPPPFLYESQSGDDLSVVAVHFGVPPSDIASSSPLPQTGFIDPGTPLVIPDRLGVTSPTTHIIPDSEVVYSPTAVDFDVVGYVNSAGGTLSTYSEYLVGPGWLSGGGVVQQLALESSINPRLLLAYIQYKTGWVTGPALPGVDPKLPLGYTNPPGYTGLYEQMRLLVQQLATGYYGWRSGKLTTLRFPNGYQLRLNPTLNAGTVALQYLFSQYYNYDDWLKVIDPNSGFMALYTQMFGDPFERAATVEPLFPAGLNQPTFTLPFEIGALWALTGGPHAAWEDETVLAAMDFAPASGVSGCAPSDAWEVAVAPGLVVRSSDSYVLLDLNGEGYEETGWVVLYMHVADKDRVPVGTWVNAGDHIGHPSCLGGEATGTHLHIARKYNGEWVGAGGPIPFVMDGWTPHNGAAPYEGTLTKGNQTIIADSGATRESQIIRTPVPSPTP